MTAGCTQRSPPIPRPLRGSRRHPSAACGHLFHPRLPAAWIPDPGPPRAPAEPTRPGSSGCGEAATPGWWSYVRCGRRAPFPSHVLSMNRCAADRAEGAGAAAARPPTPGHRALNSSGYGGRRGPEVSAGAGRGGRLARRRARPAFLRARPTSCVAIGQQRLRARAHRVYRGGPATWGVL